MACLARWRCANMLDRDYFGHAIPDLDGDGMVFDAIAGRGIGYRWAGENLARTAGLDPGENLARTAGLDPAGVHPALLASPGHRANVLHPACTYVGIGVDGGRGAGGAVRETMTRLFRAMCGVTHLPLGWPYRSWGQD